MHPSRFGIFIMLFLAFLSLVIVGWLQWQQRKTLERCSTITQGRITGLHPVSARKSKGYRVDYRYEVDGKSYVKTEKVTGFFQDGSGLYTGQTIAVHYNALDPGDCLAFPRKDYWIIALIGLAFAIPLSVALFKRGNQAAA